MDPTGRQERRRRAGDRRRTIDLTWLEDGMPERRGVAGIERRTAGGGRPDGVDSDGGGPEPAESHDPARND